MGSRADPGSLPVRCFGKLPFHREFLRVNLDSEDATRVTRWVELAHRASSAAGGTPAPQAVDPTQAAGGTPVIRFLMPEGGGGGLVAGVLRQSSDGIRRHPIALFVELGRLVSSRCAQLGRVGLGLEPVWQSLSSLLQRSWVDTDEFQKTLRAGVAAPDLAATALAFEESWKRGATGFWQGLVGDSDLLARHVIMNLWAMARAQVEAQGDADGVAFQIPLLVQGGGHQAPGAGAEAEPWSGALGAGGGNPSCFDWLELVGAAIGSEKMPSLFLGDGPGPHVLFFREPSGVELSQLLTGVAVPSIDDLCEIWQRLPEPGSAKHAALDRLLSPRPVSMAELASLVIGGAAA